MELVYFKIADKYNIIDKPNERSSHNPIVLRGGGIIFLLSLWTWAAFFGFPSMWFLLAVTLIAGISFIDDIRSLPDSVIRYEESLKRVAESIHSGGRKK